MGFAVQQKIWDSTILAKFADEARQRMRKPVENQDQPEVMKALQDENNKAKRLLNKKAKERKRLLEQLNIALGGAATNPADATSALQAGLAAIEAAGLQVSDATESSAK